MNAIVKTESGQILAMGEQEMLKVLESSLYPGASPESIKMVIGYCKAAGLDPMQKPVHIVPIWDGKAKRLRDVIMAGVGLYRTNASRTGQFAGMTEPEFGPDIKTTLGGQDITYPEWCRVTVKRALPSGIIAEFTAKEYWIENYAVKGGQEKSLAPNAMWTKRPRGQLGKCASAQAMRIAFPELGAAPTADEMEGKTMDEEAIEGQVVREERKPAALPAYTADRMDANLESWRASIQNGTDPERIIAMVSTRFALSDVQKQIIRDLAKPTESPEDNGDWMNDYDNKEEA